jgi:hypothetical protein
MKPNFCNFVLFRTFVCAVFVLSSYTFVLSYDVKAASLYFYPQNIDVFQGENVVLEVRLDTEGETVNAIEAIGKIIGNGAIIASIDTSNSLLQILLENPEASGDTFRFIGGVPGGFNGQGIIGRINLTLNQTGVKRVVFDESSRVLENSETGMELLLKKSESVLNVSFKPADYIELSSRTHPIKNKWYSAREVNIHWTLEEGVKYSYLVSQEPITEPDNLADMPTGDKPWQGDIALQDLADGIYYFSLKKVGSTTVSRYPIFQDATPPKWTSVLFNKGTVESDGKPFITFLAEDQTSGIDYYEVQVDSDEFQRVNPPNFVIEKPDFKRAVVRAYDKAGNVIEESVETKGGDYSIWIGAIFVILVMFVMFFISQRKKI